MDNQGHKYIMEHDGEGQRMENRDIEEAQKHLDLAGMRAGDRVLDAGCASGLLTRLMAARVDPGEAVGVDMSDERIAMANARAKELGLRSLRYFQGDLYQLPFPDNAFDCTFSRYTFEYLKEPARALKELKRVTREGGRVIVADLDGNGIFHYPIPPDIEKILTRLTAALSHAGFDPFVGRKLYHLFHKEAFRRIQVHALPHHLIAGAATPVQLENWEVKLSTIRPYIRKGFPSDTAYEKFVSESLELLRREDTLTYSVTFLVIGVV